MIRSDWLLVCVVAYAAASLFHYGHNAEFLGEYPNLPAWLSRAQIYSAWLGLTALGALGIALVRLRYRFPGLVVLAVYALLGFDGLAHYAVAPPSAHTPVMNLTIWLEALAAGLLLAAVVGRMFRLPAGRARSNG
jgi:hypothetical protein